MGLIITRAKCYSAGKNIGRGGFVLLLPQIHLFENRINTAQARGMLSPTETLLLLEAAFLLNGLNLQHRTKPLDENKHRKYSQ